MAVGGVRVEVSLLLGKGWVVVLGWMDAVLVMVGDELRGMR